MKSSQLDMKVSTATVTSEGTIMGTMIRKKYTVPAASVDFGRFVHITGNAANELHDEEDIEPAGKEGGNDHGKIGTHPAHAVEQHKARDHHNLAGQHHGDDHQHEPDIAALEFDTRKAESDKRGGGHHAHGRQKRYQK